ncbi:MAG: hypothetical protein HY290_15370 [Planctomycetia bacterium]|nr:hypothetical protein [Planctomycetia bacterium]
MSPEKIPRRSGEIYTDILYQGLLAIRATEDLTYARALADHLHNLPHLIQNLEHAGLHDYYWRAERSSFLQDVTPEQARIFESLWQELEAARQIETRIP